MSEKIFTEIEEMLKVLRLDVVRYDKNRPWGGFFVIRDEQAQEFANFFFNRLDLSDLIMSGKLSPKILIVAPKKRLSGQYHFRRAEIWKVLRGSVGVVISETDHEGELFKKEKGDCIKLQQGERHRLVGLDEYGVLAEIWQHTDFDNPSDEDDIVRLQDDFGR
ncbi:phosphoheptose isomerase [Pedobacter sp. P351]|uniref:phosphoheptose isomerase n=1 Tax=Pedobacter superstes TaxID=3133441 RepID=UPI003094D0AB